MNPTTRSVRHVPISPALRSVLVTRAHRSGHVFGENRYGGRPAKQAAVTQAFRRLMRRLGIENASHHTLRHTGASFMLAEGISVRVVQEIGGWTSLRMLERYTHPTDAEKLRAVEMASRLTRVGTKTGTAVRSRNRRTRRAERLCGGGGMVPPNCRSCGGILFAGTECPEKTLRRRWVARQDTPSSSCAVDHPLFRA